MCRGRGQANPGQEGGVQPEKKSLKVLMEHKRILDSEREIGYEK